MKSALLKHGGWTSQGSREDIRWSGSVCGIQWQITTCSDQTGPHATGEQFRQRFAGHNLRTSLGQCVRLKTFSQESKTSIIAEAMTVIIYDGCQVTSGEGQDQDTGVLDVMPDGIQVRWDSGVVTPANINLMHRGGAK
jgi:hypothetical protein